MLLFYYYVYSGKQINLIPLQVQSKQGPRPLFQKCALKSISLQPNTGGNVGAASCWDRVVRIFDIRKDGLYTAVHLILLYRQYFINLVFIFR